MKRKLGFSAVLAIVVIVAGCGKGGDNAALQVAAKVNGDEVSVQQITAALSRGGNPPPPEQFKTAAPQALETMIEQQLLVQKAVETKFDREAKVMQTLEGARKQIIAQAYIDKVMSAAAKPAAEEIQEFYDKNPALFAQRRIYRFQELSASVPEDKVDALKKLAQKAKNVNEISAWLKSQNIPFGGGETTKPAEQLPMELLPELARMSDGQIALIPAQGRVAILQLAQSQQAPLDIKQATPFIEQFLMNGKRLELAKAEVKKLRDAAKIEYVGDFDKTKPAAAGMSPSAAK